MKHKISIAILLPLLVFISCSKNVVDSKANVVQINHDIPGIGTSVNLSTASSLAIQFLQARFHNQHLSVQKRNHAYQEWHSLFSHHQCQ